MRALILAAGRSTRIAARAGTTPKPMLPIGGEPILFRAIRWLAGSGVRDLWINLHHQAGMIRAAVGDGSRWGVRVQYSYEPELLGTAGAWKRLAGEWNGTSLVVYGDNVMRFDLAQFRNAHERSRPALTMAGYDPAVVRNTGIAGGWVQVNDRGFASAFVEGTRITGGLVNAGAYLIEPEVAQEMSDGFLDFGRDVLPSLSAAGRVRVHALEPGSYCLGVDTPERLDDVERLIAGGEVQL